MYFLYQNICIYEKNVVTLHPVLTTIVRSRFNTLITETVEAYIKYPEIAELLCCSIATARRKCAAMRQKLGLPKYSHLTKSQILSYFGGTK